MSWPVAGILVAALVLVGAVMRAAHPPRTRVAQISFSAAAILLGLKTGWWLAFEATGVSTLFRVIVALVIPGVIGAWWIAAFSWARKPSGCKAGQRASCAMSRLPSLKPFSACLQDRRGSSLLGFSIQPVTSDSSGGRKP